MPQPWRPAPETWAPKTGSFQNQQTFCSPDPVRPRETGETHRAVENWGTALKGPACTFVSPRPQARSSPWKSAQTLCENAHLLTWKQQTEGQGPAAILSEEGAGRCQLHATPLPCWKPTAPSFSFFFFLLFLSLFFLFCAGILAHLPSLAPVGGPHLCLLSLPHCSSDVIS